MDMDAVKPKIEYFAEPAIGKVSEPINAQNPGRVWFQATYWPARLHYKNFQETIFTNQYVTVVGRQGITLLIRPYFANPQ